MSGNEQPHRSKKQKVEEEYYCDHPDCREVASEEKYTSKSLAVHKARSHIPSVRSTRGRSNRFNDYFIVASDSDTSDSDSDSDSDLDADSNLNQSSAIPNDYARAVGVTDDLDDEDHHQKINNVKTFFLLVALVELC